MTFANLNNLNREEYIHVQLYHTPCRSVCRVEYLDIVSPLLFHDRNICDIHMMVSHIDICDISHLESHSETCRPSCSVTIDIEVGGYPSTIPSQHAFRFCAVLLSYFHQ